MMNKSREQFEVYIKSRGMSAMKRDGRYVESATRFAHEVWKASRAALCPKCGGTGMADSGGVQPWGEPIEIPCDCPFGDMSNEN